MQRLVKNRRADVREWNAQCESVTAMNPHDIQYHWQNVLFWALGLVLIAVALFVPRRQRGRGPDTTYETPTQILQRRYASGEIDQENYERMLRELHDEERK